MTMLVIRLMQALTAASVIMALLAALTDAGIR